MIRAAISLGKGGVIRSFGAVGHSGKAPPGYDVVCAAFTALARTAYAALEALPGAVVRGEAPGPGSLSFEVLRPAESAERAAGIADCLVMGMGDLAREHPESVAVTIERVLEE